MPVICVVVGGCITRAVKIFITPKPQAAFTRRLDQYQRHTVRHGTHGKFGTCTLQ